jgi:hypothetical protein
MLNIPEFMCGALIIEIGTAFQVSSRCLIKPTTVNFDHDRLEDVHFHIRATKRTFTHNLAD